MARSKLKNKRAEAAEASITAGAARGEHAPEHVDVEGRPVHGQAGGLRVNGASDALHAGVEKQAT